MFMHADLEELLHGPIIVLYNFVWDNCVLYHNCFIYFHGHEYGGTNPTLLKALAYGCSILALDTAFNKEVLDGEKYGLFFTKNAGSLTEKIQQLEKNCQIVMHYRKKSRNRILENYTWDKIASQYKTLLNSL